MNISGFSACHPGSAAAPLHEGAIVAVAEDERFTRKKHDTRFPKCGIDCSLSRADITLAEIDDVVFYHKPLVKFECLLEANCAVCYTVFGACELYACVVNGEAVPDDHAKSSHHMLRE